MAFHRLSNGAAREAREDVDILRMVLAESWPIDADARKDLIDRQMEIVKDQFVPAAVRAMAAKNILMAGCANLKSLELVVKAQLAASNRVQPEPIEVVSDEQLRIGLARLAEQPAEAEVDAGGFAGRVDVGPDVACTMDGVEVA